MLSEILSVIFTWSLIIIAFVGGAPNYYPNSFTGPLDHPKHAISKTAMVSSMGTAIGA